MNLARAARKVAITLFVAMSLGSAGLISAGTVNPIVGANLSGNPALAGLPGSLLTFGTAISAVVLGLIMSRSGRRPGMLIGIAAGILGSGLAFRAVVVASLPLFLAGITLTGGAQAAIQLSRFAAADAYPPANRGRAISNVVIGGTVGSVLGPWLVGPAGAWAIRGGNPELSGPFLASAFLFGLAFLVILLLLRPDPREVGQEIARQYPEPDVSKGVQRSLVHIFRQPGSLVAVGAMVFGQLVMVMLMGITALHMQNHQHALTEISLVISSHTFGMFAFSLVSGQLVDRWGKGPVILFGLGTLILACALAPLSPEVVPLALSLFLLGLGWNFSYVGGSSLLADQLAPGERARAQGVNDLLVGLASAAGSFSSGLLFAAQGYTLVGMAGLLLTLIPLCLAIWWQIGRRRPALTN
jgi:MFS family permease